MQITSIINHTGSRGKAIMPRSRVRERECVQEQDNKRQNNYDNINTSIKRNPDARVVFRGGVPVLHKLAEYAQTNPLSAEAICATFYAGLLRPISVMAMARDEEEKEKCKYQAAKSIASAYIGLFSTVFVGTVISAGTDAALKNNIFKIPLRIKLNSQKVVSQGINVLNDIAKKHKSTDAKFSEQIQSFIKNKKLNFNIFDKKGDNTLENFTDKIKKSEPDKSEIILNAIKKQKVIDKYTDTAKNVADKLCQPIWMPIRAFITVELVSPIVKHFGLKKPDKNKQPNGVNSFNAFETADNHAKEVFQTFSGTWRNNESK